MEPLSRQDTRSNREIKLSKYLSKILRHQPQRIGLELDADGWADVDELVRACRGNGVDVDRDQLIRIATDPRNPRYEFDHAMGIRALYGHSVQVKPHGKPERPPDRLFHGTGRAALWQIERDGILPMTRTMVHLSASESEAFRVARRRSEPVVLGIRASAASDAGFEFYRAGEGTWLVESVLPEFVDLTSLRG